VGRPVGVAASRARRALVLALALADALAIILAVLAANMTRFAMSDTTISFSTGGGGPQGLTFLEFGLVALPFWLLIFASEGLYDLDRLFWSAGELTRAVRAISTSLVALILFVYALKWDGVSRGWTTLLFLFACAFVLPERLAMRTAVLELRRRGRLSERALIVGTNDEALHLVQRLEKDSSAGLKPVGCVSEDAGCLGDLPSLGTLDDVRDLVTSHRIDTVLVASTSLPHQQLLTLFSRLRGLPLQIHLSSGLSRVLTSRVLIKEVAGVPLITVKAVALTPAKIALKRTFDLVVGALSVLLLLPVWLPVAILVKLTSRGPALYRQTRVGRGGRHFAMLKFRSMVEDADQRLDEIAHMNEADGHIFKVKNDPRLTRVGWLIRRFSIDELPQLINVLRGEMSLVGPRPPIPGEVEGYEDWHYRRFETTPGMTGLWQVSGRSKLSFDEMVTLDIFYIENWSLKFDLGIMMRTVPVVLLGWGAY
jgi:exopolysaccharide biosynthesis polyprenyl glycosylphosphotransferase